ncbi:MAG: nuclear transport factor 2 family protein [Myxococcales bacterium]|nr:nuclear transport factor 2 family protein [Myxococcales bacterium]
MTSDERLDRLESIDEIRQLVAKYCLALDMRDLDALVGLFPEDVRVGGGERGRAALKRWFDDTLRLQFTGTAHVTGNHIVELESRDAARGLVYSRNEHETGDEWVVMTMLYWDRYERIDGRWLFRRRLPLYWYATDQNAPPIGANKMRWPDREPYEGGYHDFFPSWREFWASDYDSGRDVAPPAPLGEFLARMRPDERGASVRVR